VKDADFWDGDIECEGEVVMTKTLASVMMWTKQWSWSCCFSKLGRHFARGLCLQGLRRPGCEEFSKPHPELKERLVALSTNGALPYSTVPLLEQFQALAEAETELNQCKSALLEED
jgi:hypothetical protein